LLVCASVSGFIFAGSEIYGGLAGTWDYGPLGSDAYGIIFSKFGGNIL
jgi:glycyl-tRNA synthetase